MEYAYPLKVLEKRSNPATGSHGSIVWYNFLAYARAKYGTNADTAFGSCYYSKLSEWNACNDEGRNTISFKTEADRTLFLLRFT